jgi:membrane-associated phospholipid phosphatase
MIEFLQQCDRQLFLALNNGLGVESLDPLFLFLSDIQRNKIFMSCFILILTAALIVKFGKKFVWAFVFVAASVGVSDLICYRVIKQTVTRERPFQNETLSPKVRKVGHAHGSSFPSNHAANTFAGATSLSFLFPHLSHFLFGYAFLVALSRVYVGVHYPFDVSVGALIGISVALLILYVFRNQLNSLTGRKP